MIEFIILPLMAKKKSTSSKASKKTTTVRTHPRHVKLSEKNPNGITIVDQHLRRVPGTFLDEKEIYKIANGYSLKGIKKPSKDNLESVDGNLYDNQIALWTNYFNKLFNITPALDPNMIKALIGSESNFKVDARTPQAIGIAQITKQTLKIVQDPNGEVKDFIFSNISQKDLENPDIAIPIAVRWLTHKKSMVEKKLGRPSTHEDIILEYKGLLKSDSTYKSNALKKYRKYYDMLTK